MTVKDGIANVRKFGAKGDGVADDTAAIQAAIDAALDNVPPAYAGRTARASVHIPSGMYRITSPIRVYSAEGLKIYGDGFSTRLIPVGRLDSVLDLNGVAYCVVEGLLIRGDGKSESVTNAIHYYWDRATAYRSSTGNVFRDITVLSTRCVTAFRVGKPGDSPQVDNTSYFNMYLAGDWRPGETKWYQAGFHLGTGIFGNILSHHVYHLTSSFWGEGVRVDATNYAQWGGGVGQNGVDYQANTLAYFTVQGVRSETSNRFFASIGPSSNDALYSLADIVFSGDRVASDGEIIRMNENGNLYVRNLQVFNVTKNTKIVANPPLSATIRLEGINVAGTVDNFLSGIGPNVVATVDGYFQSDASGGRVSALNGPLTLGASKIQMSPGSIIDFGDGRRWGSDGLYPGGPLK